MNEHKSSAGKGGMGFLGVLQIVFIVLKLCKLIKWSWPVVLIPLWIEIALRYGFIMRTDCRWSHVAAGVHQSVLP